MVSKNIYDIIVIGAGHAGCEAALAGARLGMKTMLATLSLDNIALMPCNPSIGGPAKGHLVREIDALGGQMGIIADAASIQMRMLNTGKGHAVQALRSQSDKNLYQKLMKDVVERQENLEVKQLMIDDILVENQQVQGVLAETGEIFYAPCVILATGTYLSSKIIYGKLAYESGPNGLRCAGKLSANLAKHGVEIMRFKTGTPARVDARSLDYSKMQMQEGDKKPLFFSFLPKSNNLPQVACYLAYTNEHTHRVIHENMDQAAVFNGLVEGVGPRYCPSIESKLMRFQDKDRHQLFIEPEGLYTQEMYVQGMSSSLPADVQEEFLKTIEGMENVKVMRSGYAIDYDCLDPLQLQVTLEHKKIGGLYSAGQSNGTSGYEEAAAQGLMAGVNATLKLQGKEPFVLTRAEAYIGVLIDDLVTKGTNEPYRMMTSRAEYRLLLRQDNADIRLTPKGLAIGLVDKDRYKAYVEKTSLIDFGIQELSAMSIAPTAENNAKLEKIGTQPTKHGMNMVDLLRRNEVSYAMLVEHFDAQWLPPTIAEQIEINVKYDGYIQKQQKEVEKALKLESKMLPMDMEYEKIRELGSEAREKLSKMRPVSIGQASRISGVSPADINVLLVHLEQRRREKDGV